MKAQTRDQKRAIKHILKASPAVIQDPIEANAEDSQAIAQHAEGGRVGVAWTRLQAGGKRSSGIAIIPATVPHLRKWLNRFYSSADGYRTWRITHPKVAAQHEQS